MHKMQTGILFLLVITTINMHAMKRKQEPMQEEEPIAAISYWHILTEDILAKIAAICNSDSRNQLMMVSKTLNHLASKKNVAILHNNPLNIGKEDTIYYLLTAAQKDDFTLLDNLFTNNINPEALHTISTEALSFTEPLTKATVQKILSNYRIEIISLNDILSHYILALYTDIKIPSSCFLAVYHDDYIKQQYHPSNIDHSDWLLIAASNKYDNVIKFLLTDNSIQINKKNASGNTSLHIATINGDTNIIKILLTHPGININEVRDLDHLTVIHLATCFGHLEIIKLLLEYDETQLDKETNTGCVALHCAVYKKQIHCIEYFLTQPNIQVNKQNHAGDTALHLAVIKGRIDLIKALLKHQNIKINIKNENNETPLDIAKRTWATPGYQKIEPLLLDANKSS